MAHLLLLRQTVVCQQKALALTIPLALVLLLLLLQVLLLLLRKLLLLPGKLSLLLLLHPRLVRMLSDAHERVLQVHHGQAMLHLRLHILHMPSNVTPWLGPNLHEEQAEQGDDVSGSVTFTRHRALESVQSSKRTQACLQHNC